LRHLFYQIASWILFGALMPLLWFHPKLRQGIRQRFGFYRDGQVPPRDPNKKRIWLHGASAGDLLALMPVIQELRALLGDRATLIVSTMTNSGHAIGRDKIASMVDAVLFVPYDLPGATRRAVRAIQPDLLVLEYAELWPNLIHAVKSSGARIALTNGRLSESLMKRYRMLNSLFGNQLAKIDLLLMREEREAERALTLGAPRNHVRVTGNTKFDNLVKQPDGDRIRALGELLGADGRRILVAGSTHEGEERDLLRAFRGMRDVDPSVRIIVAPRYVERAGKIQHLAEHEGFTVALRSRALEHPDETKRADVIVLDTMGELTLAYGLATLVFVGGSFVSRGGQNILEPAGQGRPVLFGPYMMNFRDSVEVLLGRGGIQVKTPDQLEKVGRELLSRPEEIEHLGEMAREAVKKARGASRRNAELLLELVRP
jgi:3-deoxy-D-manno-octulosonic-acid transferase